MRSYKIITLLVFIASSIAGGKADNKGPQVEAPNSHVQCADITVYSIRELKNAAIMGCRLVSFIGRCRLAGNCRLVQKYVLEQYNGDGFGESTFKMFLWNLPKRVHAKREESALDYRVVFDVNPELQKCKVYGAVYKDKTSNFYNLCRELVIRTVPESWRGRSRTRYNLENLSEKYPAEVQVPDLSRDNSISRGYAGNYPEEISQPGPSVRSPRLPTSDDGLFA